MTREEMQKVIVTGGAGFVGSHLVDRLVNEGIETYIVDNLSTGSLENISQHEGNALVHFFQGDVKDVSSLLPKDEKFDAVFHEAAIASVPISVENPKLVHDVNVNATIDLLNFCVNRGIRRFVFASSAAVYGVVETGMAEESAFCRPASPYGASKLAVECYLHAYRESFGLEPVMLRYFNIYGRRQKLGDYSGVIQIFTKNLQKGIPPTIYGDGMQTRDFVNVADIVQANILAMRAGSEAVGEVFNVASGESVTIRQLLNTLVQITGRVDLDWKFVPARAGDVRNGRADIAKAKRVLGFSPSVSLKNGLTELVKHLENVGVSAVSSPQPISPTPTAG